MKQSLYQFYQELKKQKIIFCYSGPLSQKSLEGVGSSLRRNLELEEVGKKTSMTVFSVFVEQVQNIINYSIEKSDKLEQSAEGLASGVIVIGREDDDYFIQCGNKVLTSDIPTLSARLEEVRSLDQAALKALYKERRRQEPDPGSKGAGLGLIEMARKAGGEMQYSFESIDQDMGFFSIRAKVKEVE